MVGEEVFLQLDEVYFAGNGAEDERERLAELFALGWV